MKKRFLTFFTLLLTCILFSQNKKLEEVYTEYFKYDREIPYLHLNKTSFFKGEEVWFKAYVLNGNTQKLHKKTSNLHCSIYDEKGIVKAHKMLFVKNGLAYGSFMIDSTFTNQKYYLKASTNYMKNFVENEPYLQEITIIDNEKNKEQSKIINELAYDLQVLPEGGHVLANTVNTFGVILKDSEGKSPKVKSGRIIDNKGNTVEEFSLNKMGLGKISANIKVAKDYHIEVILQNGKKIIKPIPSKNLKGIILSVDNSDMNVVKLIIRTNKATLKKILEKTYTLFIHNTASSLKKEFNFKKETYEYTFYIIKRLIKPGTNIVTLFDDKNNPLAERVFFNYQKSLFSDVSLNLSGKRNDSVTLNIKKQQKDSTTYFLSSSILPKNTKANNPKNYIFSNVLLKPFIKGDIPDITYFFEETNKEKLLALDLLLLTQGWSKYNWHTIFNEPPVISYEFEQGIDIKGKVNTTDSKKPKKILLASNINNLFLTQNLDNDNFEFKNLYLENNSTVSFSFLHKKGRIKKLKAYITTLPLYKKETIVIPKEIITESKKTNMVALNTILINDDTEFLEEVDIVGKLKFKNNPIMLFGIAKKIKIDDTLPFETVHSFLQNQGFRVTQNLFSARISTNRFGGNQATRVFLDDFEITDDGDELYQLGFRPIKDFDEVFISKTFGGEIHLYSSTEISSMRKNNASNFLKYKVTNGYSPEKEYYSPKYTATNTTLFENYGTVYWNPKIKINDTQSSFKFPVLNQKEIVIHIQGITSLGKLINKKKIFKNISIKENATKNQLNAK